MEKIKIDPITRLEGHGKITILLDEGGEVSNAYFQVPELRGFEKFAEGRPAEEMPRITPRICGVCPTAHLMASAKALDDLYNVDPSETGRKIRELIYNTFMFEDHTLHFYYLGGPDFIVGPEAEKERRNILGVLEEVGLDIGKKVINARAKTRKLFKTLGGGKPAHGVNALPGGVSKGVGEEEQTKIQDIADETLEFAKFSIEALNDIVLANDDYVDLIMGDAYYHETYYMGLVDEQDKLSFYDGDIKVVDPAGENFARFGPNDYLDHISEHVEPWSYIKFPFLKEVGWNGFTDGPNSGIYRVNSLARLNVADGMATDLAQEEYERFFKTLGESPVHNTLAYHWARLIEALQAAERMKELAEDPALTDDNIRNIPTDTPDEGIGAVEAPRGTLYHHYTTDEEGIIQKANLIVATVNNSPGICMSIEKAARELIHNGQVEDGILNKVEMAFRAYDPCLACATHSLPGNMPLEVEILNPEGEVVERRKRS